MRSAIRHALWRHGITPRSFGRLRWVRKACLVRRYGGHIRQHVRFICSDPEVDNFTYDIDNDLEMCAWISSAFGVDQRSVCELLVEARTNRDMYEHLHLRTRLRFGTKTCPPLGRRLGWYVIVRLVKPSRIVETGTHDGLGTLVLLSALARNAAEGRPGELVSVDPDPTSGWIVGPRPNWTRCIADSREVLHTLLADAPTQVFLHDSLHTYAHERFEFETATTAMRGGVLLSDNSHATPALREVCDQVGGRYHYWHEEPRKHFYPGAGIGLAILPDHSTPCAPPPRDPD